MKVQCLHPDQKSGRLPPFFLRLFHIRTHAAMDVKKLFSEWLSEEIVIATKKGSKAAFLYSKAQDSLQNMEAELVDLKTLRAVKYIGERTVKLLVGKLERHCKKEGLEFPSSFELSSKRPSSDEGGVEVNSAGSSEASGNNQPPPRKKAKRTYIPAKRSGGYSILLALYSQDYDRNGLTQEEVIKHATPFCDKSFKSNPAANQFYSSWNSIKQLEKHDLVKCSGRPKRYYLTDEGLELASKLKVGEGLVTPQSANKIHNVYDEQDRNFMNDKENTQGIEAGPSGKYSYGGVKYDIWDTDSYEIVLVIDTREVRSHSERDFFQKTLSSSGIKCEVMPLSVGDGIWIARHLETKEEVVLNYIFERKRIDDLAFSIRDGRFQEQKTRLKMAAMKHNYYIVEEAGFDQMGVAVSGEALQTAISMTITNSNFFLRKFKSIEDTISFLASLTEVIIENHVGKKALMVLKPNNLKNQSDYEPIISMFRSKFETTASSGDAFECVYTFETFKVMMAKSMVTVKEIYLSMLMCIRGISPEKAYSIQGKFKTPKTLLEFFNSSKDLERKDKINLISEMFKYQVGNKKIGPAVSEKVFETWGI